MIHFPDASMKDTGARRDWRGIWDMAQHMLVLFVPNSLDHTVELPQHVTLQRALLSDLDKGISLVEKTLLPHGV